MINKYFLTKMKIPAYLKYYLFNKFNQQLPKEYVKLNYIESDGNSYINTGIIPDNDTGFKVKLSCVVRPTDNFIYGAREGTNGRFVLGVSSQNGNYFYFGYGNQSGSTNEWYVDVYSEHSLELNYKNSKTSLIDNKGLVRLNGTLPEFNINTTITIFGRNYSGSFVGFRQRVYENKISQNSQLVRNFIPCKRIVDNEIGMYDLVSKEFFTNAGSGSFIGG